jgi:hypothetical protein
MSLRSVTAAAAFVGLAVLMTWPLAAHLSSALPGPPGDNVGFLWNFWWMRKALSAGVSPFWTSYLFAPYGIDLTLNTNTALPAFVGATALARVDIVVTQNILTIATLALNGFAAYRLARRFTTDDTAAFIGGVIFAMSAYITAHLLGHFNLVSAYVLPLFALTWMGVCHGSRRAEIAAGLVLGATAFIDYYYLIYQFVIAGLLLVVESSVWSVRRGSPGRAARVFGWTAGIGAAVVAVVIAIVAITGGLAFDVGRAHVSMRSMYNPLQIFWLLTAIWVLLRWSPRLDIHWRAGWSLTLVFRAVAISAAVFLVLASPLIWHGARLMASGEYVSQQYFWRSAPSGIDLATLALGNPLHPIWGHAVLGIYERLGLSQTESLAWLGLVPMWLAFRAIRRERSTLVVQLWLVLGGVFFIWAMGPHLRIFGLDTGMILPQTLLRYVPIASNARMPARAMVVVCLAVAMLGAIAVAHLRARSVRPALVAALVVLGVVADQIPAPDPLLLLERPPIYNILRDRPEPGALCELPTGTQDGFGTTGLFNPRVMFYQTMHERPIVGGMVSRIPASVRTGYENDPVLSALVRLSDPAPIDAGSLALPTREQTAESLRAKGVSFVMLDRTTASHELLSFVDGLSLEEIARDSRRTLYRVPKP